MRGATRGAAADTDDNLLFDLLLAFNLLKRKRLPHL